MRWIKNRNIKISIIIFILIISLALRFYRLPEYMTFLGDEGRDALIVKKILIDYDFPLLGAPTSVGNIHDGPLYYYMMAVAMGIFWLNPVAAAGMVALIGTVTVGLIFYLSNKWFGLFPAIVSSLLYSISPVNIIYSRSSWNPNPAPFFTLLIILSIFKFLTTKNYQWLLLLGGALSFAIQMHLLCLILVPILGFFWILELVNIIRKKTRLRSFLIYSAGALLIFFILMSPLLIYDFKYNFNNYKATKEYFSNRETTVNLNVFNTLDRVYPLYTDDLIGRYFSIDNIFIIKLILSVLVLVPLFRFIYLLIQKRKNYSLLILGVWLIGAILGLSLVKTHIYDHYLTIVNPVPFILFGSLFSLVHILKNRLLKNLSLISLFIISGIVSYFSLVNSPLLKSPNNQLWRTQEVAKFIIKESQGKSFNFALISKNNYDAAYKFYLDIYGHKPKIVPTEVTDQLFVVCEDLDCNPVGHPKQEISHFGWVKIEYEKRFEGVKIYKLVNYNY